MYKAHYTPQTVANMFLNMLKHNIYLDATYLLLRRDMSVKETVHIAIGIYPDGCKEFLNYQIALTESAVVWRELLQTLRNQEIEETLLFIIDGINGAD